MLALFFYFYSMKFIALKYFTKRSEGLKPYNAGDEIELSKEDGAALVEAGFVKAKARAKKK